VYQTAASLDHYCSGIYRKEKSTVKPAMHAVLAHASHIAPVPKLAPTAIIPPVHCLVTILP